jgi:hypothetical protein
VKLYMRSADRRPDPAPLRTDDRPAIAVGTAIWALLLIAALVLRADLADSGRGWWVWTPVVGIALGVYGLRYVDRRRRAGKAG